MDLIRIFSAWLFGPWAQNFFSGNPKIFFHQTGSPLSPPSPHRPKIKIPCLYPEHQIVWQFPFPSSHQLSPKEQQDSQWTIFSPRVRILGPTVCSGRTWIFKTLYGLRNTLAQLTFKQTFRRHVGNVLTQLTFKKDPAREKWDSSFFLIPWLPPPLFAQDQAEAAS